MRAKAIGELIPQGSVAAVASDSGRVAELEKALSAARADKETALERLTTAIVRNDELLMQVERLETRAATEDRTPPAILSCFSFPRIFQ